MYSSDLILCYSFMDVVILVLLSNLDDIWNKNIKGKNYRKICEEVSLNILQILQDLHICNFYTFPVFIERPWTFFKLQMYHFSFLWFADLGCFCLNVDASLFKTNWLYNFLLQCVSFLMEGILEFELIWYLRFSCALA